ncbi:hypothetical protein Cni_G23354 [Canna indica]|uniref:Aquaporin TIP4-4 n=1 Tax=Canna indica TaxID=4628 RepID=A0AAQ3KTN5_9LILI|nr:hypothetical protein Cni_G23354 [Canna indica]
MTVSVFEMTVSECGSRKEAAESDLARSVFVELLLTFLFVFVGVGAAMTAEKMEGGQVSIMGLMAAVAAAALLVPMMVAVGLDVSAGHVNPAVTIGFAIGGHVTALRCALYVTVQLMGSSMACLLLEYITGGELETLVPALGPGVSPLQGVIMELVLTFSIVFCVYAVVDPGHSVVSGIGPLLVGLVVGANALAGAPFSGASMNPARSFGPSLVSWNWTNHWVY